MRILFNIKACEKITTSIESLSGQARICVIYGGFIRQSSVTGYFLSITQKLGK